ncbi:MAG: hypothetical protein KH009_01155 [Clostridiales bacterium]|nr:hypothetical protein [Clostridiales bacterium]
MNTKELDTLFTQRLLEQLHTAAGLGLDTARMESDLQRLGGARLLKGEIRRGRPTQLFDALSRAGYIGLTPEALAVSSEFAELFTDAEADFCFELLCEAGYYRT